MVFFGFSLLVLSPIQAAPFSSSVGGFSVDMPGNPEKKQVTHKSFLGPIYEYSYHIKTPEGGYSVAYSDIPKIGVSLGGAKTILRKAKKGFLKKAGGKEARFTAKNYLGNPGRELIFNIPQKGENLQKTGVARFYLIKNRLFVLVGTTIHKLSNSSILNFLNSFRVEKIALK